MKSTHHPNGRPIDCIEWWAIHRRAYNIWLFASAIGNLILCTVAANVAPRALPDFEITIFSLLPGALTLALGFALANVCYMLGPIAEGIVRPRDIEQFRRFAYQAGVGFSIGITIFPSLFALIRASSSI